jgi:hypothetical protein
LFAATIDDMEAKVNRAYKVARALKNLNLIFFLGVSLGSIQYANILVYNAFPINYIQLLLRYLDEGGAEPVTHYANDSGIMITKSVFDDITNDLSKYRQQLIETEVLNPRLQVFRNPFTIVPEYLRQWPHQPTL